MTTMIYYLYEKVSIINFQKTCFKIKCDRQKNPSLLSPWIRLNPQEFDEKLLYVFFSKYLPFISKINLIWFPVCGSLQTTSKQDRACCFQINLCSLENYMAHYQSLPQFLHEIFLQSVLSLFLFLFGFSLSGNNLLKAEKFDSDEQICKDKSIPWHFTTISEQLWFQKSVVEKKGLILSQILYKDN